MNQEMLGNMVRFEREKHNWSAKNWQMVYAQPPQYSGWKAEA